MVKVKRQKRKGNAVENMIEVESSNIKAIGYDDYKNELFVRFKSGKTYLYKDVPVNVFTDFHDAESKGKFFFAKIKKHFESTEVLEEETEE